MAVFMIGYDLHKGEDYKDLIDAIKSYGTWWHCLDSTWLIKTDQTAAVIRDRLFKHIKKDDELLVFRYGKTESGDGANAAWYGFSQNGHDVCHTWLKNNL